jgi:hypothetical protein
MRVQVSYLPVLGPSDIVKRRWAARPDQRLGPFRRDRYAEWNCTTVCTFST